MPTRRPRAVTPASPVAVRELTLYADNTYEVYQRSLAFELAAARRMCRGKYDPSKAPALWKHFADEAAKAYDREHGSPGAHSFTASDRRAVASARALDFEQRVREYKQRGVKDLRPEVIALLNGRSCKL